ncbi:hypothetical protein [Kitasatospora sp. NPDC059817]|uniref:hypothetical protein n=1 Tax=Kitasatospora sp. NPDC059817 TaxID=3346961 RepID=UPI003650B14F
MLNLSREELPERHQELLDVLVTRHDLATERRRNTSFVLLDHDGRRFAVCEYGAHWYEEGVPVHLAVDLTTGSHVSITAYRASAMWPGTFWSFFEPGRVPSDDPVRAWLATPAATPGPRPSVAVAWPDQLERFCAAELVRTDQPELLAQAELVADPELPEDQTTLVRRHSAAALPYAVLFRHEDALSVVNKLIGSGRGCPLPEL